MLDTHDIIGRPMLDRGQQHLGTITAVYRYPGGLDAPWGVAEVRRGWKMFATTRLVDLRDATTDGKAVVAAYPKTLTDKAPAFQPLIGNTLSDRHAAQVLAHYQQHSA